MKKFNKIMTVLVVLVAMVAFVAPVFAVPADPIFDANIDETVTGTEGIGAANTAVGKAWNTIKLILQIAAIGAIVFAGVRYMFASADQKADIKKSMGILAIGAALVFGATYIIDIITNITQQVTQ